MAIADGFEVWLATLDKRLADQEPPAGRKDFDPLLLFKAYENGTPPSTFARDPAATLHPPVEFVKRLNRPATAARPPYWQLLGIAVILVCFVLSDQGLGDLATSRALAWESAGLAYKAGTLRRLPSSNPERKQLASQITRLEDDSDIQFSKGLILTIPPITIMFVVAVLMFNGALANFIRLNCNALARFERVIKRVGGKPRETRFPYN